MNDFNAIAPVYDVLASIVFLGRINRSQKYFLPAIIKSPSNILIIGGGTGGILTMLDALQVNVNITYVDSSNKMVKRARQRAKYSNSKIEFITADFLKFDFNRKYDIVIANYFFDLFADTELNIIVRKIMTLLDNEGKLLVTDFETSTEVYWQKCLYSLMLHFFRKVASVSIVRPLEYNTILRSYGFEMMTEKKFYRDFIATRVYRLTTEHF